MNRRSFFGAVVGGILVACGVKSPVRDVPIRVKIERSAIENYPDFIVIYTEPIKYQVGMRLKAVCPKDLAKLTVSRSWRVV